jgi:hypothetical protein
LNPEQERADSSRRGGLTDRPPRTLVRGQPSNQVSNSRPRQRRTPVDVSGPFATFHGQDTNQERKISFSDTKKSLGSSAVQRPDRTTPGLRDRAQAEQPRKGAAAPGGADVLHPEVWGWDEDT